MELSKSRHVVNYPQSKQSGQIFVDSDLIVPDAKPDVLKIIQVDANAAMLQKEIFEGKMVIKGKVDYKILYVPEEGNGITGIANSAFFTHTEEMPGVTADMTAFASIDVEHIEFNLINSRKISIKTVVASEINVSATAEIEYVTDINGSNVSQKSKTYRFLGGGINHFDEVNISSSFDLPSGKPSISALLKNDLQLMERDIKIISNKVILKSEIKVCSLYNSMDGSIEFVENMLPFTEIIDVMGINEDMQSKIKVYIKDNTIDAEYDEDGDMRRINCLIKLGFEAVAEESTVINVLDDAYSTAEELQLIKKQISIQEKEFCQSFTQTVKDVVLPPDNIPKVLQIYNVVAKPYVSECQIKNEKVELGGAVDVYILYLSGREDYPIYSFKHEIPFSFTGDASGCKDNMAEALAETGHISYTLNSAGEIELRAQVKCEVESSKTSLVDVITDVKEMPFETYKKASVVMYFVQKNDDLWSIAKRYKTNIDDILSANGLEDGKDIQAGRLLLIPN